MLGIKKNTHKHNPHLIGQSSLRGVAEYQMFYGDYTYYHYLLREAVPSTVTMFYTM